LGSEAISLFSGILTLEGETTTIHWNNRNQLSSDAASYIRRKKDPPCFGLLPF
jgi:hypothetical protein